MTTRANIKETLAEKNKLLFRIFARARKILKPKIIYLARNRTLSKDRVFDTRLNRVLFTKSKSNNNENYILLENKVRAKDTERLYGCLV